MHDILYGAYLAALVRLEKRNHDRNPEPVWRQPGAPVATYMWDISGCGLPVNPIYWGLMEIGAGDLRPVLAPQSNRDNMQKYWEQAGMKDITTDVVRIQVAYDDFDDFWKSATCRYKTRLALLTYAASSPLRRSGPIRWHARSKASFARHLRINQPNADVPRLFDETRLKFPTLPINYLFRAISLDSDKALF